jgi:ATP-dependent DNA helicase RecG
MDIERMIRGLSGAGGKVIEGQDLELKRFDAVTPEAVKVLRRAVVCLANSDGGWIVLGVDDSTGEIVGCPELEPIQLMQMVYDGTRPGITMHFERHEAPEGHLLYYGHVPRSVRFHATSDGARYHRVGDRCLPLYPDEELRLMMDRGTLDVSAQPVERIEVEDLDDRALELLVDLWSRRLGAAGNGSAGRDDDPLTVLHTINAFVEGTNGKAVLSMAAAILIASQEAMQPVLPRREITYVRMAGDTEYSQRLSWKGPMLTAIDEVVGAVMRNSRVRTIRIGVVQHDVPDFPATAVREAVINAIVHRTYLLNSPILISHHDDRLEVTSPGGFGGGVSPDNILHHAPFHRNALLVDMLHALGLVEEIGVGVDRIYSALLRAGKEPPLYEATPDFVRLHLRDGALDEGFMRFVEGASRDGKGMSLDDMLVLHFVKRHRTIDRRAAAGITQRQERVAHEALSGLVMRGLLVERGRGRGAHYGLSDEAASGLGVAMRELRHPAIGAVRARSLVLEAARTKGHVTNSDVQQLLGLKRTAAWRLLDAMVDKGQLRAEGAKRGRKYLPTTKGKRKR